MHLSWHQKAWKHKREWFYPDGVAVLVLQQRLEQSRRGIVQLQRPAEFREFLPTQRADAVGIETVENLLQALLVVVLLLAVIHPTGQQPALDGKQGRGFKRESPE